MRFITTNDLESWSMTTEAKFHLPHLIRKLVLATIDNYALKDLQFPYGEDVNTGGYDGEINTEVGNLFVPVGESVWEFGTTNNKGKKANDDYEKRKQDSLGKVASETTYINVTAKRYRDKLKWEKGKREEGFWKEVKYLDALDIEQWLELAPSVELWLAEKLGKPTSGIYSVEEYWNRWSINGKIKSSILLGKNRVNEIERVKDFFQNEKNVIYIKSITIDEALGFALSLLRKNDLELHNSVVIDNRESFNRFSQSNKPLLIITKFKLDSNDLNGATQRGHKIIIPISIEDEINSNETIRLPIVSREAFEMGLEEMGINREQRRVLIKSSGINISILKRIYFEDNNVPKYLGCIKYQEIIPMLLINSFSENYVGDKEIVELLSGKSFDEYIRFLQTLVNLEDSPIYYIDGIWKLISTTDIWLFIAKYVTQQDFDNFKKVALEVLIEVDYDLQVSLESRKKLYFNSDETRPNYSSQLKKGLSESLAVIAVFGEKYGVTSINSMSSYVNSIVEEIFNKDVVVWRSLSSNMAILAEAAPTVFLKNLERIIKENSFVEFFEVKNKTFRSRDLAYVLWSLEILAWFPEHLMRVSRALCDIIIISPDSFPTTNTPTNSLLSIYRIWYPQTNVGLSDRKQILSNLLEKYPDTIYNLMLKLLKTSSDFASSVPRPKWRLFSELKEIQVPLVEYVNMRAYCMDIVIENSKGNIQRIMTLIDLIESVDLSRIDDVLVLIENDRSIEEIDKAKVYHRFRKLLGEHRSYPDAKWALSTAVLDKIEMTALKFKPTDYISNELYLFEDYHPVFIEGKNEDNSRSYIEEIQKRRIHFVEEIINQYGIEKIIELTSESDYPQFFGRTLALSDKIEVKDKMTIYKLIDSSVYKLKSLVKIFIGVSENRTNLQAQLYVLDELILIGISLDGQIQFLNCLNANLDLWYAISKLDEKSVEKLYWKSQHNYLHTLDKENLFYALDKLQTYNKPITLLNTLGWGVYEYSEVMTSDEVLTILENISFDNFDDSSRFDNHNFKHLLKYLYSREDYNLERGAKVEMKLISLFSDASSFTPLNLFKLMSQKPEEYFNILKEIYLSEKEELRESEILEIKGKSNFGEINRVGSYIFRTFNLIDILEKEGKLDFEILKKWILDLRELATLHHRLNTVDDKIGMLLARYPIDMRENKGFPDEIYDIIEDIGTKRILQGFSCQIFNNLGFTSRMPYDGGNIEKFRSNFFNTLFEETKILYPSVSTIFAELRDGYLLEARSEDAESLLRSLD